MQNLHLRFVLCGNDQINGGDLANFLAFSKYMSFELIHENTTMFKLQIHKHRTLCRNMYVQIVVGGRD